MNAEYNKKDTGKNNDPSNNNYNDMVLRFLLSSIGCTSTRFMTGEERGAQEVQSWMKYGLIISEERVKQVQASGADATLASTASDLRKLAVFALRLGQTPDGRQLISRENWMRWATVNLLKDGASATELAAGWNAGFIEGMKLKTHMMKIVVGRFGWNFFGAVYNYRDHTRETHSEQHMTGWQGFLSSVLLVNYKVGLAFIGAQLSVTDPRGLKTHLANSGEFANVAESLQCKETKDRGCQPREFEDVTPFTHKKKSVRCEKGDEFTEFEADYSFCPAGRDLNDFLQRSRMHRCYIPRCYHASNQSNGI